MFFMCPEYDTGNLSGSVAENIVNVPPRETVTIWSFCHRQPTSMSSTPPDDPESIKVLVSFPPPSSVISQTFAVLSADTVIIYIGQTCRPAGKPSMVKNNANSKRDRLMKINAKKERQ